MSWTLLRTLCISHSLVCPVPSETVKQLIAKLEKNIYEFFFFAVRSNTVIMSWDNILLILKIILHSVIKIIMKYKQSVLYFAQSCSVLEDLFWNHFPLDICLSDISPWEVCPLDFDIPRIPGIPKSACRRIRGPEGHFPDMWRRCVPLPRSSLRPDR